MRYARSPIVVGRDKELGLAHAELDRVRDGSGGLLAILGEQGIGKSRLAEEVLSRAAEWGMVVLRGRSVDTSTPMPFRPFAEALSRALRPDIMTDPDLAVYVPALGRLIPDWVHGLEPTSVSPISLLEAVLGALAVLSRKRGVVVVLEDLQWADEDSLSVLEYLADTVADYRILCIYTLRTDEPSPAAVMSETLVGRSLALPIRLGRLSEAQVSELVVACLDKKVPSPEALWTIYERSEGVPFFVEELLAAYVREEDGLPLRATGDSLPASYRDSVRSKLSRLDAPTVQVLTAGAVLGRVFDWALLPEVTGLSEASVLTALRLAVDAQLLTVTDDEEGGAFEFRHTILRDSILAELLLAERRDLSLRAARVLEGSRPGLPGELCETAAELRLRGGDRAGAFRLLMESARRALTRTALHTAESTAERARGLADGDPWLEMGADLLLTDALAHAGRVDRLREVGDRALEAVANRVSMGTPGRLAVIHLRVARGLLDGGHASDAVKYYEQAVALAARADDKALASQVRVLGAQLALAAGDLAGAEEQSLDELSLTQEPGPVDARVDALRVLSRLALYHDDPARAVSLLDQAAIAADDAGSVMWRARVAVDHAVIDELTDASLEHAREASRLIAHTGAVPLAAQADYLLARIFLARFELLDAEQALRSCLEVARRFDLPMLREAVLLKAALVARGGVGDFGKVLSEAEDAASDSFLESVLWGEVQAVRALVTERRITAIDHLQRGMELTPHRPMSAWTYPGLWILALGVENATMDGIEALAPTGALAHQANVAMMMFSEAVRLGRDGLGVQAHEKFSEADETASSFPWHRHMARRLVAEAALKDEWGDPGAWLLDSLPFFESAHYDRMVAACRGLLRKSGHRVPRRGRGQSVVPPDLAALGVTSREMDVHRLVGEGLSNSEIADELYISPRTVQTHTSSLLRKLGVSTRAQLVAQVARTMTPSSDESAPFDR